MADYRDNDDSEQPKKIRGKHVRRTVNMPTMIAEPKTITVKASPAEKASSAETDRLALRRKEKKAARDAGRGDDIEGYLPIEAVAPEKEDPSAEGYEPIESVVPREEYKGFKMPPGMSIPQRRAWRKSIRDREESTEARASTRTRSNIRETGKGMGESAYGFVEPYVKAHRWVGRAARDPEVALEAGEFIRSVGSGDKESRKKLAEGASMGMVEPAATAGDVYLTGEALGRGKYGEAALYGASVLLPWVSAGWLKSAMRAGEIPPEAAKKIAELEERYKAGDVTDEMQIRRELAAIEDAHKADYQASLADVESDFEFEAKPKPDPIPEFDYGFELDPEFVPEPEPKWHHSSYATNMVMANEYRDRVKRAHDIFKQAKQAKQAKGVGKTSYEVHPDDFRDDPETRRMIQFLLDDAGPETSAAIKHVEDLYAAGKLSREQAIREFDAVAKQKRYDDWVDPDAHPNIERPETLYDRAKVSGSGMGEFEAKPGTAPSTWKKGGGSLSKQADDLQSELANINESAADMYEHDLEEALDQLHGRYDAAAIEEVGKRLRAGDIQGEEMFERGGFWEDLPPAKGTPGGGGGPDEFGDTTWEDMAPGEFEADLDPIDPRFGKFADRPKGGGNVSKAEARRHREMFVEDMAGEYRGFADPKSREWLDSQPQYAKLYKSQFQGPEHPSKLWDELDDDTLDTMSRLAKEGRHKEGYFLFAQKYKDKHGTYPFNSDQYEMDLWKYENWVDPVAEPGIARPDPADYGLTGQGGGGGSAKREAGKATADTMDIEEVKESMRRQAGDPGEGKKKVSSQPTAAGGGGVDSFKADQAARQEYKRSTGVGRYEPEKSSPKFGLANQGHHNVVEDLGPLLPDDKYLLENLGAGKYNLSETELRQLRDEHVAYGYDDFPGRSERGFKEIDIPDDRPGFDLGARPYRGKLTPAADRPAGMERIDPPEGIPGTEDFEYFSDKTGKVYSRPVDFESNRKFLADIAELEKKLGELDDRYLENYKERQTLSGAELRANIAEQDELRTQKMKLREELKELAPNRKTQFRYGTSEAAHRAKMANRGLNPQGEPLTGVKKDLLDMLGADRRKAQREAFPTMSDREILENIDDLRNTFQGAYREPGNRADLALKKIDRIESLYAGDGFKEVPGGDVDPETGLRSPTEAEIQEIIEQGRFGDPTKFEMLKEDMRRMAQLEQESDIAKSKVRGHRTPSQGEPPSQAEGGTRTTGKGTRRGRPKLSDIWPKAVDE